MQASDKTPSLSGHRILIVEDEPLVAYDLADLISDLGGEVVGPAFVLTEAQDLISKNHLDAALLDIDLGNDRVWPLALQLKTHGTPFAFISGQCNAEQLPKPFAGYECLEKPAAPERISALAAQLCGVSAA